MIYKTDEYISRRGDAQNFGPSRGQPNKHNREPKMSDERVRELGDFLYIKVGARFNIPENSKIAKGIGYIEEVRGEGVVLFVDATGKKFNMLQTSPLLKLENKVE